ncbi:MAG: DEAD/DEAH box helicase [Candidatus Heimdallarchaeota archaeon]|nr:MAG: DEAD/DEAH box helicase [Candidatus Heimdallarchaeota archaeon]
MSFDILDPRLQKVLDELGLSPTPRQLEYLEAIIAKEDVLIVASTGSGKTFGTIIACLHRILIEESNPINTVVITPLKALNRDIFRRVLPSLGEKLGISIAVRHGDTTSAERRRQTKNPPQILISTPELFQALLPAKILGRERLKNVQTVVIDEIHELVETKRGVQLSLALERLSTRVGKKIQRIGISATLGNPKKVMEFLAPENADFKVIEIPSLKQLQLAIEFPSELSSNLQDFTKILQTTEEAAARFFRLVEIIEKESGTVLLFTNTRQQAEILGYRFNRYNENIDPDKRITFEVHHSSLSAQYRLQAETEVREGNLELIIATSSLELGIDIGAVSLVIQYMSPRRIETLIQRVGRAGHGLDRISRGIIIAENPRDLFESFTIQERVGQEEVEPTTIHSTALDILFHSIVGILLDFGETNIQKIMGIIKRAYPYKNFTSKDFLPLLQYGKENHFFFVNKNPGTGLISLRAKRKAYQYYYSNLSSIPTKKSYSVVDIGRQSRVGHLDEAFVSTRGEKGAIFILNGLPWEFLAQKEDRIEVRQVKGLTEAAIPTWEGELIPVSQMVAEAAKDLFENDLIAEMDASPVQNELLTFIKEHKKLGIIPTKHKILIESAGRQLVVHSFLGSKGNETLGLLISSIVGAKQGHSVEFRSDPYSIFLSLPRPTSLVPILESIKPEHIFPLLKHRIGNSDLFNWRIRQVAKRFGAVTKDLESSPMVTRLIVSRYKDTIIGEETINEILCEKMDVNAVINFFTQLHTGIISIEEIPVKRFESPLSFAATQPISLNVLKLRPSHIILEKVEKRIRNTWIRLVCMRLDCKFEKVQRVESLAEDIQCPKCHSRFIAIVHQNKTGTKGLLKKSISKDIKLTREEKKEINTAKKSADLILSFGKKAAFVLAGRGIGPTTAIRILRSPQKDKEDLLALIYKHEADFARTREYWD